MNQKTEATHLLDFRGSEGIILQKSVISQNGQMTAINRPDSRDRPYYKPESRDNKKWQMM